MTANVNIWLTHCWLILIRLVSKILFNSKGMLTNDTNCSYLIAKNYLYRACLTNHMGLISHHITNLGG